MVKAINKNGIVAEFSDRVWDMLKDKNGWVKWDGVREVVIPDKVTEFMVKKKEDAAVSETKEPLLSEEQMKDYLSDIGVKFHPRIGYAKLKALYNDHTQSKDE